jgi:hypothetical protein
LRYGISAVAIAGHDAMAAAMASAQAASGLFTGRFLLWGVELSANSIQRSAVSVQRF